MDGDRAPWQHTFLAFAGPGIRHPAETLRVTEAEARAIRADLAPLAWQAPAWAGTGRHRGYAVCNAIGAWTTALFCGDGLAGFYAGSYLWIDPAHRGRGLAAPLILAAARHRGGTVLPPGVVVQGYTPAGLAAHRSAHRRAVAAALARGLPVPAAVAAAIGPGPMGPETVLKERPGPCQPAGPGQSRSMVSP